MDALMEFQAPADIRLAEHAEVIRTLGKRVVGDILEIGRRLTDAKVIAEKKGGHGAWLFWIDREFGWSEKTARNFLEINALVEKKSVNFTDLDLPISGLYLLAAPLTPADVVDAVIVKAESGESMSLADIKKMIADAKGEGRAESEADASRRLAEQEASAQKKLDAARLQLESQIRKLKDDLEGTMSLDQIKAAIAKAVEPLNTKISRYEERIERLQDKKNAPRDEFGLRATAITGRLSTLAESLVISQVDVLKAVEFQIKITEQTMLEVLSQDIKNAKKVHKWLTKFIELTGDL